MLIAVFFLTTTVALLQGILFPQFCLFAYAPWIAYLALHTSLPKALWLAALAGAFFDLFSDHPMGVHAIAFAAATALLFRFRTFFAKEEPLSFALFSMLASWLITFLLLLLLFLFDRRIPFRGKWAFVDFFIMPIADGLYAWMGVAYPLVWMAKVRRYWVRFWLKKKNPSLDSP